MSFEALARHRRLLTVRLGYRGRVLLAGETGGHALLRPWSSVFCCQKYAKMAAVMSSGRQCWPESLDGLWGRQQHSDECYDRICVSLYQLFLCYLESLMIFAYL